MLDFCRTLDAITLEQEADLIIQQIDVLFDTNPGEVIGYPDFGADYDRFIHELNVSSEYIENYVYSDIIENVDLLGWSLSVEVELLMGEQNDIILMKIEFSKNQTSYSRVYRIESEVTPTL